MAAADAPRATGLALVPALILVAVGCRAEPGDRVIRESSDRAGSVTVELRVGVAEGDDPYMFGNVTSLAVGRDGAIFAYDRQVDTIRMYDAAGIHVRDVGRAGQAPGEYEYIEGMIVLPDGTLVARDVRRRRVILYDSTGQFIDEFDDPHGSWNQLSLEYDLDGNLWVRGSRGGGSAEDQPEPILHGFDRRGQELAQVPIPSYDLDRDAFLVRTPQGVIAPFVTSTRYDWSTLGYLVVGRNDAYAIELRDPAGARTITRQVEPVPLDGEERGQWEELARFAHRWVGRGEVLRLPAAKPFFRNIYVGDEGRIWVERYVESERHVIPPAVARPEIGWSEPVTYDVFAPDTEFLGTVVVPRDIRVFVWRGPRLWGVETDGDGIVRIVRMLATQVDSGVTSR